MSDTSLPGASRQTTALRRGLEPLLVGLAADPNWSQWGPAQFTQVGFVLGGAWLAGALATAAQVSLLALFTSELLILSRLPYAMARDGLLPQRFTRLHPRFGTSVGVLVTQALVLSVLTHFWEFIDILGLACIATDPLMYFSVQCQRNRSEAAES